MRDRNAGVVLAVGLAVIIGIPVQHWLVDWPIVNWALDLAILGGFLLAVGIATNGRLDGVLIDERNKVSLSRLQTAAWSVVVIGSFVAYTMIRLKGGVVDPLAVAVPEELWVAIGITATALVGTPIIHQVKQQPGRVPSAEELAAATVRTGTAHVNVRGYLVVNQAPSEASWGDMFRGEEAGNTGLLDIGKIQMFWFTGLLVVVYLAAVAVAIGDATSAVAEAQTEAAKSAVLTSHLKGLPVLSAAFVALLAISNGTYLASKAAPHTQQQPPQ